jgi:hypothetical protein
MSKKAFKRLFLSGSKGLGNMLIYEFTNLFHRIGRFSEHGRQQGIAMYHPFPRPEGDIDSRFLCLFKEFLAVFEQLIIFAGIYKDWRETFEIAE